MALQPPKNDPVYWGAALALAVRDGDKARIKEAQRHLRRLGVPLTVCPKVRKAVRRA